MRHHPRFWLSSVVLGGALLLLPALASAQTPEPAAGNPAINNTPTPSGGNAGAPAMASPSNETNIPKGSNPEGGSGNLGAGSGATPSSSAIEHPTPGQTANNPESSINDSRPSQTATNPDAGGAGDALRPTVSGSSADTMSQGQYAAPPTDSK